MTRMPARPRDSAATRAALLAAARELFATAGYDGTTVRAIAERAGVNQALLFRHFGSKDGLFAEALTGQALEVLHDGPAAEIVPRTVRAIMTGDDVQLPLFLSALRSAGNSEAAGTVREELRVAFGGALAELARGGAPENPANPQDSELRAELTLAWLLGIALLRTVLRTEAVVAADPDTVVAHVSRAVETLLGTDGGAR